MTTCNTENSPSEIKHSFGSDELILMNVCALLTCGSPWEVETPKSRLFYLKLRKLEFLLVVDTFFWVAPNVKNFIRVVSNCKEHFWSMGSLEMLCPINIVHTIQQIIIMGVVVYASFERHVWHHCHLDTYGVRRFRFSKNTALDLSLFPLKISLGNQSKVYQCDLLFCFCQLLYVSRINESFAESLILYYPKFFSFFMLPYTASNPTLKRS